MQPRLFRQRLLELASEYEGLHAESALARRDSGCSNSRSLTEVPEAPAESAEGGAAASPSGDGESALLGAGSLLPPTQAVPPQTTWPSLASDVDDGRQRPGGDTLAQPNTWGPPLLPMKLSRRDTQRSERTSITVSEVPSGAEEDRTRRHSQSQLSQLPALHFTKVSSQPSIKSATGSQTARMSFDEVVRRSMTFTDGHASRSLQVPENRPLVSFVKSRIFSVASAMLIIMSTLLIGVETQVLSSLSHQSSGSEQLLTVLSAANYLFTFMFAVEVMTRIYALGIAHPNDRVWNCFDIVILLLALVEVALDLFVHTLSGNDRNPFDHGGMAKMLRLFRLTRLLRIVRTFRQLKPLRVLVHSIASAGKSVFWALMLLFMIVYAFGVILTQAVTEHTEGGARIDDEDLVTYYGDLFRSMLSLWMAVSGGINWHDLTVPLEETGDTTWMMLFLLYITFVYFFVLNVVTGVFCQNAVEGAQQDLDLTIEAQLKDKQVYADRLRLLFEEMKEEYDAKDGLTAVDIYEQMAKPKVQSWFRALDIDAKQTWKLCKILDSAGSGRVSLQDFTEGCLQMRGSATRVDVESLKWEIREIRSASARTEHTTERIARLLDQIRTSKAAQGTG